MRKPAHEEVFGLQTDMDMLSLLLDLTFKELPSFGTGVDEWRQNPDTAWCSYSREEMKNPWLMVFSALVIFAPMYLE